MTQGVFELLKGAPVLPVVAFQTLEQAVPIAKALMSGGLRSIEVTLRTDCALEAIGVLAREIPELTIGAGTVTESAQLAAVKAAGARFAISPGLTPDVLRAASEMEFPYLPGVATASEIMMGISHGYRQFKFFPASVAGGPELLKAWAGPFPDIRFCPTGGIDPTNLAAYLALGNVRAVGSSWMLPAASLASGDWREITNRSRKFVGTVLAAKAGSMSA